MCLLRVTVELPGAGCVQVETFFLEALEEVKRPNTWYRNYLDLSRGSR